MALDVLGGAQSAVFELDMDKFQQDLSEGINQALGELQNFEDQFKQSLGNVGDAVKNNLTGALSIVEKLSPLLQKGIAGLDPAKLEAFGNSLESVTDEYEILQRTISFIEENMNNLDLNADEIKQLSSGVKQVKEAFSGIDTSPMSEAQEKVTSIFSELRKLKQLMASQPDSPLFTEWKKRAEELTDSIDTAKQELKLATSETAGIDAMSSALQGLVGGFSTVTGAIGLFTDNTEEAEQITKSATSALALLNGLQAVGNTLAKEGALNVYLLSLMRGKNAAATGAETAATVAGTAAARASVVATEAQVVAQKGLAAIMKTNPAAVLMIGITALIGAYQILKRRTDEVSASLRIKNDIEKSAIANYAKEVAQLMSLQKVITDSNASRKQRNQAVDDYNKLADQANKIDKSSIDNTALVEAAIARQTDLIRKRALARAAENVIAKAAETLFTKQLELEQRFPQAGEKAIENLYSSAQKVIDQQAAKLNLKGINAAEIVAFSDIPEDQLKKAAEKNKKLEVLFDDRTKTIVQGIKKQVDVINANRKNEMGGNAGLSVLVSDIETANNELEQALSIGSEFIKQGQDSNKSTKDRSNTESDFNEVLNKRKKILQELADLEREADNINLDEQDAAVAKVNEKYQKMRDSLIQVNAEIEKLNDKSKKKIPIIDQSIFDRLDASKAVELQQMLFKQETVAYLESIKEKKAAFDELQKAQTEGNEQLARKTRELFANDVRDFGSFIDFLRSESLRLQSELSSNPGAADANAIKTRLKSVNKLIVEADKEIQEQQKKAARETFAQLLEETKTYNEKRNEINAYYDKLESAAINDPGLPDQDAIIKALSDRRKKALTGLADEAAASRSEFERLFEGVERLSDKAARKVIEDARKLLQALKTEGHISQEFADQVGNALRDASESLDSRLPERLSRVANGLSSLVGPATELNESLGQVLQTLTDIIGAVANVKQGINDFKSAKKDNDVLGQVSAGFGIVGTIAGVVSSIVGIFKKAKEERRRQQEEIRQYYQNIFIGEQEINKLYRERSREQVRINKLKLEGIKAEIDLLKTQKVDIQSNFDSVLSELQKQTARVRKNIFGGIGTFARESLAGKTFDQLEELYLKGQLEGRAKELFELLRQLRDEGVNIDTTLAENAQAFKEALTGTNADSITDSILDGFKNGLSGAADFADTFQDLMRNAVLQSLKLRYLEGPLKDFFNEFALLSESDGQLTSGEISQLQALFNNSIESFSQQFEQLQQIAGIDFGTVGSQANSLTGAIRGMTEQQAELLAAQFGGLRITALEQLNIAKTSLQALNDIQVNTGLTVAKLERLLTKFDSYETGTRKLKVEL